MKVLVVCTGNRHRSPVAAAFLRSRGVEALSAGVSLKINNALFPPRTRAIVEKLPNPEYRSKRVTVALVRWADAILIMQPSHAKSIVEQFPNDYIGKGLITLAQYHNPSLRKIPDPGFNMAIFDEVVRTLDKCVENFVCQEVLKQLKK